MIKRYEAIVGSRTNVAARAVDLALHDATGTRDEIQVAASAVQVIIAALGRHLGELQTALPADQLQVQELRIVAIEPAMLANGLQQIHIKLAEGGVLALSVRAADLQSFADMFAHMAGAAGRKN